MIAQKYKISREKTKDFFSKFSYFFTPGFQWFVQRNNTHLSCGVVVGKKKYPLATRRNALKRFVFDVFREKIPTKTKIDIILLVQKPVPKAQQYDSILQGIDRIRATLSKK